MCGVPAYAFLDAPRPLAFAHRGGAGQGVENTMSTFAAAVELGYRYVETDVHATADGVLVAFHDRTLHRITGINGRIEDLTWRELSAVPLARGERVPLLADLLGTWPHLRVNIDVKTDRAVAPLIEALHGPGVLDRVCIASFSDARIRRVRAALGPRLCTALATGEAARLWLRSRRRGRRGSAPAVPCAQVPAGVGPIRLVDRRLVRRAHDLALQVHVWTVDDPGEMDRLLDLGADGIMTDEPATLREVLTRRGVWHA